MRKLGGPLPSPIGEVLAVRPIGSVRPWGNGRLADFVDALGAVVLHVLVCCAGLSTVEVAEEDMPETLL